MCSCVCVREEMGQYCERSRREVLTGLVPHLQAQVAGVFLCFRSPASSALFPHLPGRLLFPGLDLISDLHFNTFVCAHCLFLCLKILLLFCNKTRRLRFVISRNTDGSSGWNVSLHALCPGLFPCSPHLLPAVWHHFVCLPSFTSPSFLTFSEYTSGRKQLVLKNFFLPSFCFVLNFSCPYRVKN